MTLKIIYLSIILATTVLLGWISAHKLRRLQKGRRERLDNQPSGDPMQSPPTEKVERKQRIKRMETRFSITRRTISLTILLIGMGFAALPFVKHISPTMLPVLMGVISVIIGIAARPFIENMICGLVLCYSKLARIGDTAMVDDAYGVIEDVTLTHCIIKRWDSLRYVVPNSSMMTKEFVNYSLHDNHRWVIVEFWVDYNADFDEVEALAVKTPLGSAYFAPHEDARFWVVETEQYAVKCMVTAWSTSPAEGWMLGHDIRRNLIQKMKEHGITTHTHRIQSQEPAG